MLAPVMLALVSSLGPPALPDEAAPRAEPSITQPSSLSWEVDAGCPEVDHFVALLRRFLPSLGPVLLDGDPSQEVLARIQLRIRADASGRWQVDLQLNSALGREQRVFEAERCELAVEAAALVVSVVLDPVLVVARTGVPPADEPEPQPEEPQGPQESLSREAQPEPVLEIRPEPAPEPRPSMSANQAGSANAGIPARIGISAMIGGGYGPLQAGSWAFGGQLALLGEDFRVSLGGAWHPALDLPLELDSSPDAQLSGRFDAWRVGAQGCWVPHRRNLEFPLCGLLEAGQVRGEGLAPIPLTQREASPYLGLGLAAWLWWAPVSRFALGLGAESVASLLAQGFSIDGAEVQRYTPVGVRGMAAVELRLP